MDGEVVAHKGGSSVTVALLFPLLLAAAPDAPHRIAIVVGANEAAPGRARLRFAHNDARAFADALVQVGHFASKDVDVLYDPAPDQLTARMDMRLAELRGAGGEGLLLFYYSGHADDRALYPHGEPLPFAAVRDRLEQSSPTVRVGIIDACRGGGWTQAKGLTAEPPFEVQAPLGLASEGSVLIASSSGLESAHESDALQGSFFTHYFVAGMLGAASQASPGTIMLGEAFSYAQEHTVRDTALQVGTPQHPSFSIHLKGRSDLALANLDESPSSVSLRETKGPLQLIEARSGVALLEVPPGERSIKLAVPAGRYLLRRAEGDRVFGRDLDVEPGKSVVVDEESLVLTGPSLLASKGESVHAGNTWRTEFGLEGDTSSGVTGTLTGTYFIEPLFDDGVHAYDLLRFLQRPDTLSASVSADATSSYGGTLSGEVYPWRDTGFSASVGLSGTWNGSNGLGTSYSLGIRHYFLPTLRVELAYEGGFDWYNFGDAPQTGASDYAIGALDVTALVLNERLRLLLGFNLNHYTENVSAYRETYGSGSLSATYFFSRKLSLELSGVLGTGHSTENATMFTAGAGASVQYYFTPWIAAGLRYEATYLNDWGSLPPGVSHSLSLTLSARF
jgi:hypothetical protein